jgi:hypothetical protein
MQSATLPTAIRTARTSGRHGLPNINGGAPPNLPAFAPADRLNAAKGSLVGMALSAGLWAAIIGFIALLRH